MVTLGKAADSAGLVPAGPQADTGDVAGLYYLDRIDADAVGALPEHALRRRIVLLPRDSDHQAVDDVLRNPAVLRAAAVAIDTPPAPGLRETASQLGVSLLSPGAGREFGDCVTHLRTLLVDDIADQRAQWSSAGPATSTDGSATYLALLRLLDRGAASVDAHLHLDVPGAVVNPVVTLSERFLAAATAHPATEPGRIPKEGRVLRVPLERPGCSLMFTRDSPDAWQRGRVDRIRTEVDDVLSTIAVSRSTRGVLEQTFIRELVSGDASTIEPWAATLGLRPGHRVSALVVDIDGDDAHAESVENAVRDLALATTRPVIAAARQNRVLALIPKVAARDDLLDAAVAALPGRLELLLGRTVAVGASSSVFSAPDDLVLSLVSASQVAERGRFDAETADAGATGDHGASARLKIPLAASLLSGPEASDLLTDSVLAALITHDRRHDSAYEQTLRTYLALGSRMTETADALGVHVNTLRYRLGRIEALTGRDLHSIADLADFYLALVLRENPHHGSAGAAGNSATSL